MTLSTDVPDAEIRCTTDGEIPTSASPLYSEAVTLSATTELRALPFVGGAAAGAPGTAVYIARTIDATSDIPIVLVDGYGAGKPEDKTLFVDAAIMVFEPTGDEAKLSNPPTLATGVYPRLKFRADKQL